MKKLCFLLGLSLPVLGQNLEQTFALAQNKYQNRDYLAAAALLERVSFFDTSGVFLQQSSLIFAQSLMKSGQYEKANLQFEKAYGLTQDSTLQNEILINKSYCLIQDHDYLNAEAELLNIDSLTLLPAQKKTVWLQKGIVYFGTDRFEESEKAFSQCIDSSKIEQLHKVFVKNQKTSKISPHKARVMSMIIPGSGQIYAGDIKNGLNSMGLLTALGYWGFRVAAKNTPLDAIIAVLPWFQRYYLGGFKKAEGISQNAIIKKRNHAYQSILDLLTEQK